MSVLLTTADNIDSLRWVVSQYARQSLAGEIEVIITCPRADDCIVPEEMSAPFFAVRVIEQPNLDSVAGSYAAGIRAAAAPIVSFGEDHSFPATQDWAEIVLARHREPWSGVGPVIENANPANAVSIADWFVAYGPWVAPNRSGETKSIPGHNSSYKKAALLEFGEDLPAVLQNEFTMHQNMTGRGHRLYVDSRARTMHTNFELLRTFIGVQKLTGWFFAATRAANWPLAKRIGYVVGSPLIPAVRAVRILRQALQAGVPARDILRAVPALAAGLASSGVGEAIGYLQPGRPPNSQRLFHYELKRLLYAPSVKKRFAAES